ncbi:MAG: ROK family transcriptional regulator [Spirochaetia bacterium]|jgi:predicted NBD/HSP70 family sugar kinase|nr:ROK family transcriptional regulator [Spirochaetia bacterium]
MKNINRFEILQMIYQTKDINRNVITQTTGLTSAAVTKIINSLIAEGVVSEKSFYSEFRKRRSRYLSICRDTYATVILCLCRNMVKAAIVDISGSIIYSRDCQVSYAMLDDFLIGDIVKDVFSHIQDETKCLGCVCISPGIRSAKNIVSENSSSKSVPFFWNIEKIQAIVEKAYHVPFYTENDSNAALLGEMWFGAGRESKNTVLYNIGKGIGSAVCLNGSILSGYQNSSIEIGHVTINFNGPQCACGNRGCLELYAGLDHFQGKLATFNEKHETNYSLEETFSRARNGDEACNSFVHEYALMVAEGAVILANMFKPEKIIVTTNEADFLYLPPIIETIKEEVFSRIFSISEQKVKIEASTLRSNGYMLGGVAVAVRKYFLGDK